VSDKSNGYLMAFGAGALLFAVTIEMFAAGKYAYSFHFFH
jgi:hypothetical protein